MVRPTKVLAIMLLGLLTACATELPKPVIDYKPDYDFYGIKTYAFAPGQSVGMSSLVGSRVEDAIVDELSLKGIQLVEPDKANILIRLMVVTENKQDIRTYDRHYGGGAYSCWRCGGYPNRTTEVQVRNYTEGTLVIDMVDTTLNRAVWHAISRGKVGKHKSPEERNENVKAVVASMLVDFPPL
ncbi:MAG: DUF4136 domain-containing protein [Oceanicoccus sp.]